MHGVAHPDDLVYQGLALIARPSQEFASLLRKLSVCRQSEREAKELLDKETYDFIFKAPAGAAGAAKGVGGGTRSAASTASTRAGGSRGGESAETTHIQRQKRRTIYYCIPLYPTKYYYMCVLILLIGCCR